MNKMMDITGAKDAEVTIRSDGHALWVNVDGECRFRLYGVEKITVEDNRLVGEARGGNFPILSAEGIAGELYVAKNESERIQQVLDRLNPRPISEADPTKEEQQYFTVTRSGYLAPITYYPGAKKWALNIFSSEPVTHFYDLSNLPKFQP